MRTVIISARYVEQYKLENFLVETFGFGKVGVRLTRGKYQCTVPRLLRPEEIERLKEQVTVEHYQEI
ncbi:hypothetical protein K469DRAFT_720968 [Zopfia rhizophila CBS 207.26]|uniref:Uncharacterized protein n=1 Tax=Zopfia rhizophila CBS 207.26 TaxID=1314779 RepID=A0A6A6DCG2_9PEZI|nr:hypothetical protein K469DRAFT_720968 [Zopfia rhizophila CBS 207.26]